MPLSVRFGTDSAMTPDIDSLVLYAGIHRLIFGFHRALSKRFPFAIFYRFDRDKELVRVYRVLDLRRDPLGSGNDFGRLEAKINDRSSLQ